VSIKGVGETWDNRWYHSLTQDPLIDERDAFLYNAMYSQVIPYLSGEQAIEQGDVIIATEANEILTAEALAVLRNCDFPRMFLIYSQEHHVGRGTSQEKISYHFVTYFDGERTVLPRPLQEEYFPHGFPRTRPDSDTA
jgi:hypothetical protein